MASSPYTAALQPSTLQGLCSTWRVTFTNLDIPCTYCNKYLTLSDKFDFENKKLQVLWKVGLPKAVCTSCLKTAARHERLIFYERQIDPAKLEAEKGPLNDIKLRCQDCYGFLTAEEKLDHISNNIPFVVITGHFRGKCKICRQQQ